MFFDSRHDLLVLIVAVVTHWQDWISGFPIKRKNLQTCRKNKTTVVEQIADKASHTKFNLVHVILHGTAVINKMNNDIKNKRPERKKYQIKKLQIKRSNKTKENKNKEKTRLTYFLGIKLKLNIDRRTTKLNKQASVKCTKLYQHVAESTCFCPFVMWPAQTGVPWGARPRDDKLLLYQIKHFFELPGLLGSSNNKHSSVFTRNFFFLAKSRKILTYINKMWSTGISFIRQLTEFKIAGSFSAMRKKKAHPWWPWRALVIVLLMNISQMFYSALQ